MTNEESGPLNMLFQFEHMDMDVDRSAPRRHGPGSWPSSRRSRPGGSATWRVGKGWNSQYLSNHDQPRPVSRFGDDKQYRVESAKLLGTFLHMLQGTPYVYEGEEIGMTNVAFPTIEDYRDIATLNMYREYVIEGGMTRSCDEGRPCAQPGQRTHADAVERRGRTRASRPARRGSR